MRLEEEQMIRQIMDTETVGYAYVYSADNKTREDYMIALTPENLANLIEGERADASKIIVTNALNRLIMTANSGRIDICQERKLGRETLRHLEPIQKGEQEAGIVLAVRKEAAEEYLAMEDEEVAMAGYQTM